MAASDTTCPVCGEAADADASGPITDEAALTIAGTVNAAVHVTPATDGDPAALYTHLDRPGGYDE